MTEAIELYEAAIQDAERNGECNLLAEALRQLSKVHHQRGERDEARALCHRSYEVAKADSNDVLAGEALNAMGVMLTREGLLHDAKHTFIRAARLAAGSRELRARAEQNLGVVANIHGDLEDAIRHYRQSLEDYQSINDEHGCAIAFHNLGMVSTDRELFVDADRYFFASLEIAERAGDVRLQGLCLLNHADMHAACKQFEDARKKAEAALVIFEQLGARDHKAGAYRVIGIVYRETGRLALAESRFKTSIEYAIAAGSVLFEAEATRELAVLYQAMGRNQEALTLLNAAHRLFSKLDARIDLINVDGRMETLETTYRAVIREWGESIESSDSYTYGHCERVADNAVAVATALGMDEQQITTIRLGAYLHDLGKVKVPHEILNKAGPLTRDEFEVIQMHPVWGVELLADVEFPWDIKPIIRWHHEKYNGAGYPDRLRGDEIPVSAQIVGIVDVYDALTTTRSYRPAMAHDAAMAQIAKMSDSWSPAVYEAFTQVMATSHTTSTDHADTQPRELRAA